MAFRLVTSGGDVTNPAVINIYASGVIQRNSVVDISRVAGVGVFPASSSSTFTTIFGIGLAYAQGASEVQVPVIPFVSGQLWEADCVNAAATANIGLRHALDNNLFLRNNGTDTTGATGVFRAVAMSSATTGSGKLIGEFVRVIGGVGQNSTTFS